MEAKGSEAPAGIPVTVIGSGFIGRRMVEMLSAAGHPVTVLSLRDPGADITRAADRVLIGNAGRRELLLDAISGSRHLIWCAGGLMPREAEADPERDRELTLEPLRTLISLGAELEGKTLTYISSGGTVYGNPGPDPVDEDHPTDPIGAYGHNKLLAERMLQEQAPAAGLALRILRCSNVYGPNQPTDRGQGAVAVFADRIDRGLEIEVYGDGTAFRDYVHVDDVVRATAALWEAQGPDVVNCGSGQALSTNDLIRAIELSLGRGAKVTSRPDRSFDVEGVVLDITRLKELITYEPVDLADGLGSALRLGAG
jgi:UDP-glucose 4-epimerase